MRIVVLDGYTLNPGDLSWDELSVLGSLVVFDRTPAHEVTARCREAEAVLTNKTPLDEAAIRFLLKLRYIGVLATGYNVVDVNAARERGIPVTNAPGYSTNSVAQLTFALLLELTHRVGGHSADVRSGCWTTSADFSYWDGALVELNGLTMGIIGFGQIGRATARLARAFGMIVLAHTRTKPADPVPGVEFVDLPVLLRTSDVVSLHCPLTAETANLMNRERLGWMKPSAFLLNTSRGPLIEEAALADALNSGRIAGAAVDVLSAEPPAADNPLLAARNCIITPHIGWATLAARKRLMTIVAENFRGFQQKRFINVVNGVTTPG